MGIKLKVCGMREPENIHQLVEIQPDFIGHIFYEKSPRFVGENELINEDESINKVGVFVNESEDIILKKVRQYNLDFVQLHGNEPVELAESLKRSGIKVIKVFSVINTMPKEDIAAFENSVDYFLFDTKTKSYGGSGHKFDWSILKEYNSKVPFFLSGGIELDDLEEIKSLNISQLFAIDVNSKFEVSPGLKNIEQLKILKSRL